MTRKTLRDYDEYPLKIGNALITFFTDTGSLREYMEEESGMHSHEYCELFYVTHGELEIKTNDTTFILKEKDAALVPAGLKHNTVSFGNTQRTAVSLTCSKTKDKSSKEYFKEFENLTSSKLIVFPSFSGADAFRRLARYHYGKYNEKKELIISCLHEIIILMKETCHSEKKTDMETMPDSTLYRNYIIESYIENDYSHASLTELASMLHLSRQQTLRTVKSIYKMSFAKKLMITKLEKASALVESTDMSFEKIAESVGYKCTHSFFSAFKKHHGTTPGKMRASAIIFNGTIDTKEKK